MKFENSNETSSSIFLCVLYMSYELSITVLGDILMEATRESCDR